MANIPAVKELNFSEFESASLEDWKKAAEASLKGKPLEKLIKETYERIRIEPIYGLESADESPLAENEFPGFDPYARGATASGYAAGGPKLSQAIPYPNPEDYNAALINALAKGQTEIVLKLDRNFLFNRNYSHLSPDAGTIVDTAEDIEKALSGIDYARKSFCLEAGGAALTAATAVLPFIEKCAEFKLLGDPTDDLIRDGESNVEFDSHFDLLADAIHYFDKKPIKTKLINIDTTSVYEAGASVDVELGVAMAEAVYYAENLIDRGIEIDTIADSIIWTTPIGSNFFKEIAKLRAGRVLFAKVLKEFGASESGRKISVYAKTARRNKSRLDPRTNMLRLTSESIAAIAGGCDSLRVGYFEETLGLPSEFSTRFSRNLQIVLTEECDFTRTADPAGGSGFVEYLTEGIARKSWDRFREIERRGGLIEDLKSAGIQKEIEEVYQERIKKFAIRKEVLIGVNKFPNFDEKAIAFHEPNVTKIDKAYLKRSIPTIFVSKTFAGLASRFETINSIRDMRWACSKENAQIKVPALKPRRFAEIFEVLRDAAEDFKTRTGDYAKVWLAAVGKTGEYKARVDFAYDFFRVGGFDSIAGEGADSAENAAKKALASGANVVCLCSSDAKYQEIVAGFCDVIKKESPNTKIFLAGYPKDSIEKYRTAGIDEFIHIRCDARKILADLQEFAFNTDNTGAEK